MEKAVVACIRRAVLEAGAALTAARSHQVA